MCWNLQPLFRQGRKRHSGRPLLPAFRTAPTFFPFPSCYLPRCPRVQRRGSGTLSGGRVGSGGAWVAAEAGWAKAQSGRVQAGPNLQAGWM